MSRGRRFVLTVLVLAIGGAAFRLSFDAQVTLARASGLEPDLAWMYPGVVDAAILTGMLLRIWYPHLGRKLAGYLWVAIAFWTLTSVVGNAIHIIALPPGSITVPIELAIAVNTVPALTLFLIIHLVTTISTPRPVQPAPRRTPPKKGDPATVQLTATRQAPPRSAKEVVDLPDVQLLEMAKTMSVREIAAHTGRGKTQIAERLKYLRSEAA